MTAFGANHIKTSGGDLDPLRVRARALEELSCDYARYSVQAHPHFASDVVDSFDVQSEPYQLEADSRYDFYRAKLRAYNSTEMTALTLSVEAFNRPAAGERSGASLERPYTYIRTDGVSEVRYLTNHRADTLISPVRLQLAEDLAETVHRIYLASVNPSRQQLGSPELEVPPVAT